MVEWWKNCPFTRRLSEKEYEKITNAFNLLKLLVPAEEDISAGRYKEARGFFKEFKSDKEI